jgi:hypothetical protein
VPSPNAGTFTPSLSATVRICTSSASAPPSPDPGHVHPSHLIHGLATFQQRKKRADPSLN